jgi:hypothetical protein
MHRPQFRQLFFHCFDFLCDLFGCHADIIIELSVFVNKKMSLSAGYFIFFFTRRGLRFCLR